MLDIPQIHIIFSSYFVLLCYSINSRFWDFAYHVCLSVELHSDKCHDVAEFSLEYSFDENPFQDSEVSVSIKEIVSCKKCLANDTLCWFHTESLKESIVTDVQNWINDSKAIQKKEVFKNSLPDSFISEE